MNEIDKAELIQGLKAFLIPTSLFIACLLGAAGTFLIKEGYGVGWGLIAGSVAIMATAFTAFINFQNKLRSAGKMVDPHDEMISDYDTPSELVISEVKSEVKTESDNLLELSCERAKTT